MFPAPNPLRVKLLAGEPIAGIYIQTNSPDCVELAAAAGLDYVILDEEHGSFGMDAVVHMIRAAEASGIVPIVRVPQVCATADLVLLPGSRATVDDLAWLHRSGLADTIVERAEQGRPVLGICGGFEMMASSIDDPVESGSGVVKGLDILPVEFRFDQNKTVRTATHHFEGLPVAGYEIHHGIAHQHGGEPFLDGVRTTTNYGTMLHGSLENDAFRRRFLWQIAQQSGSSWQPDPKHPGYQALRARMIDTLARAVAEHIDLDALLAMTRVRS